MAWSLDPWVLVLLMILGLWLSWRGWRWVEYLVVRPRRIRAALARQGVFGPPARILDGNVMEMLSRRQQQQQQLPSFRHDLLLDFLLPEHVSWTKAYGKNFLYWWGPEASISVTDVNWIREILTSKEASVFAKPKFAVQIFIEPLFGSSLFTLDGDDWIHRRRLEGPAFHFEKVKGQMDVMVQITSKIFNEWEVALEQKEIEEIEVTSPFSQITSRIIAATQFGINYEENRIIFEDLNYLGKFVASYGHYLMIPGIRFMPMSSFRKMHATKKRVERSLREMIERRRRRRGGGEGEEARGTFLDLVIEQMEGKNGGRLSIGDVVDECKTIFFAGQDTTAKLLTWACLLLANHPHWQDQARAEIMAHCGRDPPNTHSLSKLKTVEQIIYETLRLYPPAVMTTRSTLKDITIQGIDIPKGMSFTIPILALHHNKELWGEDVWDFNPARFANGLSKASKSLYAFLPFAHGPRNCIGQTFALIEAKCILTMILQRFELSTSPSYCHSPLFEITLRPRHGAPIMFRKVKLS